MIRVKVMSTNAQAVLEQVDRLSQAEQREVWRELERRLREKERAPETYGEPLTDEDIAESARVTFSMLDKEDEARAQKR